MPVFVFLCSVLLAFGLIPFAETEDEICYRAQFRQASPFPSLLSWLPTSRGIATKVIGRPHTILLS